MSLSLISVVLKAWHAISAGTDQIGNLCRSQAIAHSNQFWKARHNAFGSFAVADCETFRVDNGTR